MSELFLGGLIILTMVAVVVMALTSDSKKDGHGSDDRSESSKRS